jgi:predicted DNA-binding protein
MRTGRPTTDKKESTMKLRLNDDMREWVEQRAENRNVSMSGYIRELIKRDMKS